MLGSGEVWKGVGVWGGVEGCWGMETWGSPVRSLQLPSTYPFSMLIPYSGSFLRGKIFVVYAGLALVCEILPHQKLTPANNIHLNTAIHEILLHKRLF